jgi:acyl-CoA oxidase
MKQIRAWRRHRTHRLLYTAAQRLNKHAPRLGGFQAWNKCLSHLLALSRAHIEMVTWERFQAAVDACPDAASKKVLKVWHCLHFPILKCIPL